MHKRTSYELKKRILEIIKEKPATLAELERKADTGYRSILANCKELEDYGYLQIEKKAKHEANGKPYFTIKITSTGIEFHKRKH